jgi:aspartyl-tRNA(Asn)/glutamyl-tRNA(Gln) amidotransferase subunit A
MMIDQPLQSIVVGLRNGDIQAEALLKEVWDCYRISETKLSAYKTWSPDLALSEAKAADALFAAAIDMGPLQGIPVSVKDVYGLSGLPIFAGAAQLNLVLT